MTASLLLLLGVLVALSLYSALLLAVFAGRAYRNGYAEGQRVADELLMPRPRPVVVAPDDRPRTWPLQREWT